MKAKEPEITFTMRMPESLAKRLDALAEQTNRSRSGVMRHLLTLAGTTQGADVRLKEYEGETITTFTTVAGLGAERG